MNVKNIIPILLTLVATLWVVSAEANPITMKFSFTVKAGPLDGSAQSGLYTYDPATLTNSGSETLTPISVYFPFNGYTYVLADDTAAAVDFSDGVLLGLTYNATSTSPAQSVSFQSGFTDVTEQSFVYSIASVPQGGAGDTGNLITTTVYLPEPGTVWYMPLVGWILRKRGKTARQPTSTAPPSKPKLPVVQYRVRPGLQAGMLGLPYSREVCIGILSLGFLGLPLLIGCPDIEGEAKISGAEEELNPKNVAIYNPPVIYEGKSPVKYNQYNPHTVTFKVTGKAVIKSIHNCPNDQDTAESESDAVWHTNFNQETGGASCKVTGLANSHVEGRGPYLYPEIDEQALVVNDSACEVVVKNATGDTIQTIAPSTLPVALAVGADKLSCKVDDKIVDENSLVRVGWIDHFIFGNALQQSFVYPSYHPDRKIMLASNRWRLIRVQTWVILEASVKVNINNKYDTIIDYDKVYYRSGPDQAWELFIPPPYNAFGKPLPVATNTRSLSLTVGNKGSVGQIRIVPMSADYTYNHCSAILPAESDQPDSPICQLQADADGRAAMAKQDPSFKATAIKQDPNYELEDVVLNAKVSISSLGNIYYASSYQEVHLNVDKIKK